MLISTYTPTWVNYFRAIKHEIEKGLQGFDYTIEHVGSTAVPGLDAKPIIDIDIIYFNPADFDLIKSGLIAMGYFHNGNQGIEDRDVFKRTGNQTNDILDGLSHHLYVCPHTSKALERHILSRDYLRKNEGAKLAYQQMKYELAKEANQDRKKYAELKELRVNTFIDEMIEKEKTNTHID